MPGVAARRQNILTPHEVLVLNRTTVTTVVITAEGVVLFDATSTAKWFGPISKSAVITASGVNGRDTGSEAANTWYYIWAIGKADGTVDSLLSVSATAPTMPSGYTFKGLIGAVRNDASSNFVPFYQRGNKVIREDIVPLSGGAAASYTAVSLAAVVPPNATAVDLLVQVYNTGGPSSPSANVASEGSGTAAVYAAYTVGGMALNTESLLSACQVMLTTAQQIKYYLFGVGAVDIHVCGWVL